MTDKTPINYEDVIKAIDNFEKLDQEIVNKKPDVIIPYYTLDHLATELSQAKAEIEKKDKIIDLMAEWFEEWAEFIDEENYYTIFRKMSKEDIKDYFKNKVETEEK